MLTRCHSENMLTEPDLNKSDVVNQKYINTSNQNKYVVNSKHNDVAIYGSLSHILILQYSLIKSEFSIPNSTVHTKHQGPNGSWSGFL